MRIRWLTLTLCCVAVVGLTGCPSFSTMGLARPIKAGTTQIFVAPEALNVTVADPTLGTVGLTLPQGEIGVRYGVTDSFELGAKAWLIGAGLEGKIGLIRSPTMDSGLDLALNPGFSYITLTAGTVSSTLLTFTIPVQIGINFGGHQLVLSPKVVDQLGIGGGGGTGGAANLLYAGSSVGFAFKLGEDLRILPEVTAIYPLLASGTGGTGTTGFQGVIIQGGIGLLFGGKYETPQAAPPAPPPAPPP